MNNYKNIFVILLIIFNYNLTFAYSDEYFEDSGEIEDVVTLFPEEEDVYFEFLRLRKRMFESIGWDECQDSRLTGNFIGYKCSRDRQISKILYSFLRTYGGKCIVSSAKSINYSVIDYHIVHKGIYADSRHSPRSLHSEGRAIDIRDIRVKTLEHGWIKFNFESGNFKTFFRNLRKCWGNALVKYNSCPKFREDLSLTGSIGKENKYHQKHLHLSVPYCVKGAYGGNFFFK